MKKPIALTIFLFAVAVNSFGQAMLNLQEYSNLFLNANGLISRIYTRAASSEDKNRICNLGGDLELIDTPLEIALLTTCAGVADIRPAKANEMLGTPKQADTKLGAAVFQEIQVLRFLGDSAAVSRHEAVLKFITDRNNATRAEIETFYRDNVRALIAGVVDEEFNKISFFIENIIEQKPRSYGGVLTRDPKNGQYKLSYEDAKDVTKELTAQTLEALLAAMRDSKDFSQDAINIVRAQATLIPAVVLSDAALNEVKQSLTAFYTKPDTETYKKVGSAFWLYANMSNRIVFSPITSAYMNTLTSLNQGLAKKINSDTSLLGPNLTADQQKQLVQLR